MKVDRQFSQCTVDIDSKLRNRSDITKLFQDYAKYIVNIIVADFVRILVLHLCFLN